MHWPALFLASVILLIPAVVGSSFRIVHGKRQDIKGVPFQVVIAISQNGIEIPFCGGSIVSEKVILTASHCVRALPQGLELVIRAGSEHAYNGGQVSKVQRYVMHPKFDIKTFSNDVALMYLETPIKFNDHVKPAQLPDNAEDLVPVGATVRVSGFGKLDEKDEAGSKYLMSTALLTVPSEFCANFYAKKMNIQINRDLIVCSTIQQNGQDSCQGDSGGPLTYNGKLVGVVSFGLGCGRIGVPAAYAMIAKQLDWIREGMKAAV